MSSRCHVFVVKDFCTVQSFTVARAEKLENHILRENSKPHNVLTLNLAPYDFSKKEIQAICQKYTADHFLAGPEETYRFARDRHLKTEDDSARIKCTEEMDPGGHKLFKQVVVPMKKTVREVSRQMDNMEDEEFNKRMSSHSRALEPARITKHLAADLSDK